MDILIGLLGVLFFISILVGALFFAIFMARKIGLIKASNSDDGEIGAGGFIKSYLSDIKKLSDSLLFRFIIIAVLIGVMTIPLSMVNDIVRERSSLYNQVLNDIANTWGHEQKLQGPALFVPYTEKFITEIVKTDKDGNERKVNRVHYEQRTAIVLPNDLKIDVNLHGQTRKRSIYKSLVYTADLKINGYFKSPDIKGLSSHVDKIHWDRAWLALGISDTQAINKVSGLRWNVSGDNNQSIGHSSAQLIDFEPGTKVTSTLKNGFHAPLNLSSGSSAKPSDKESGKPLDTKTYLFSLDININGSQGFYFSPFGKTTNVYVKSDWPHPSFQGSVLPDQHKVSKNGFQANWSVPHLARNYPQLWTLETQMFNIHEFTAGVNLFETVSLYSKITRAIKYGVLFFALTYITFLIFELGIGRKLHVVQYGMIGLALSMFYLTLLSMAEHTGFVTAYISAASIIILMISLYAFASIRKLSRTGIISLLLIALYTMLYSLLKLEDYALLAGTALLLLILGVMMYLTRNLNRSDSEPVEN